MSLPIPGGIAKTDCPAFRKSERTGETSLYSSCKSSLHGMKTDMELQGHISLDTVVFPEGTTGYVL